MPTNDTTNTTTTTNVAQNIIDDNLPQLLDSRGGSHVTNVPAFDKEDFTSWKVRFLVLLDGLEPYLLKILEDGPFVSMSSLSTFDNPLPKRQNQWSNDESCLANQNDLILAHEGPSNIRDTKIAALRLKFNAFKSLEGEKVNGTFTRLKCLLNDLENNGVIIPQAKDIDLDVDKDQRTSNESMANLNAEYHERALLANQKRFYKRSGRVGSVMKPIDKSKKTYFTCGKPGHFQKDCPLIKTSTPSYLSSNNSFNKPKPYTPSFTQISSQNTNNHQKDYKGKYKGLKAEMEEEFVSLEDEGTTKIRAFMAIAEDEPSVRKANARSGQWVDITMKKVHRLLSMTDGDERKHVLDYTHVDLHYVEDQRKNLVNKFNTCSKVTLDQLLSKQVPGNVVKALGGRGRSKEKISSKEEPLPPLPKLIGATPAGTSNNLISLSDLTLNMADLTLNIFVPKKTKPTSDKVSPNHTIRKKTKPKSLIFHVSQTEKKVDLSVEQLLLTLIDEVKSLKEQIKVPSNNSPSVSQTGSSKSSKGKQTTWFGPYEHCGFKNHLAKDCYQKPSALLVGLLTI
ncbi:retrovirus-related pol polyprotein from transposon TNT 1-94 [Tanacetum coccineum]